MSIYILIPVGSSGKPRRCVCETKVLEPLGCPSVALTAWAVVFWSKIRPCSCAGTNTVRFQKCSFFPKLGLDRFVPCGHFEPLPESRESLRIAAESSKEGDVGIRSRILSPRRVRFGGSMLTRQALSVWSGPSSWRFIKQGETEATAEILHL